MGEDPAGKVVGERRGFVEVEGAGVAVEDAAFELGPL